MSVTILRRLPTLETMQRRRRAQPKSAMPSKLTERKQKKAAETQAEREAKAAVWKRAGGKCERCGQRVTRGGDSLRAGHVHHRRKRSQGGAWDAKNLILLCPNDHALVHLGAITV